MEHGISEEKGGPLTAHARLHVYGLKRPVVRPRCSEQTFEMVPHDAELAARGEHGFVFYTAEFAGQKAGAVDYYVGVVATRMEANSFLDMGYFNTLEYDLLCFAFGKDPW